MIKLGKRATAADVARHSGVSAATVSYVLRGTPGQTIPPATRERVMAAAQELGYVPNAYAQALARGRSEVIIIDLSAIPYGEAIARHGRALASALDARGYITIVDHPSNETGPPHRRLLTLARMFAPLMVISVPPLPPPVKSLLSEAGVERVVALEPESGAKFKRSDVLVQEQLRYLSARGHQTVAYCGTPDATLKDFDATRRAGVFKTAPTFNLRVVDLGSHDHPEPIAAALEPAHHDQGASAVAAYNDEIAIAVLTAAHKLRLHIPTDMAVIGIDDIPLAPMTFPALTSVSASSNATITVDDFVDELLSGIYQPPQITASVVQRESA